MSVVGWGGGYFRLGGADIWTPKNILFWLKWQSAGEFWSDDSCCTFRDRVRGHALGSTLGEKSLKLMYLSQFWSKFTDFG